MKLCVTCRKPAPNHVICSGCVERAELIMFAVTPWTKFEQATLHPDVAAEGFSECYKNSRYTVLWRNVESEFGELVHLSIKRNDKNPMHDWRDLQRIKNEILGPEHEAMELYPAESRLVDTANQYHLWCFLGMRAPFGYNSERIVMEDVGTACGGTGKQRPFEEKPKDLLTEEQWEERLKTFKEKSVAIAGARGQMKSILDEAAEGACRNPVLFHEPWECEKVKPEDPSDWCAACMSKLLKTLAAEGGVL